MSEIGGETTRLLKLGAVRAVRRCFLVSLLLVVPVVAFLAYRWDSSADHDQVATRVGVSTSSASATDESFSALGDLPLVGEVRGTDDARTAAPPPIIFAIGSPDSDDAPDLSTPSQAVYSVLELLDRAEAEALSRCFCKGAPDVNEGLYPRYLGRPVELVDVIEDRDTAKVIWNATVHTAFVLDGAERVPDETMTLTTQLVRIDGLWKLVRLHDGGN